MCSFCSEPPTPVGGIVILLVRQKRPDVDMPFGRGLRIVNDGDEPEPIPANVEHHVSVYIIGIGEHAADFQKIVPSSSLKDAYPRLNLIRRTGMSFHGIMQMLAGDDMHPPTILHNT